MDNFDNIMVGNRIKDRRISLGLTQKELAQKVMVATSTISRYEKGTIENAKLPVIESIARELQVDTNWILTGVHSDSYGEIIKNSLIILKTEKCREIFSKMSDEQFKTWIAMGRILLKEGNIEELK